MRVGRAQRVNKRAHSLISVDRQFEIGLRRDTETSQSTEGVRLAKENMSKVRCCRRQDVLSRAHTADRLLEMIPWRFPEIGETEMCLRFTGETLRIGWTSSREAGAGFSVQCDCSTQIGAWVYAQVG